MEKLENKEFNLEKSHGDEKGEKEEDEEAKFEKRREVMKSRQDELIKRGEKKDFLRRLLVERYEAEQEETLLRAQEARELRCLQVQQTQKLGEELMRRKNDEIREQKLRQQLRNDSIELRRLENQLREAYAAKAARTQLLEREIYRENMKIREIEEDSMIQGWYQDDRFEKQQLLEAHRKKEQYRRDLQEQLVSNNRLRQHKIEETKLEGKFVQDISTLRNEDQENRREKRVRAERLLAEQRAFIEDQKYWKSMENQATLKEQEERARILADKINVDIQNNNDKATIFAANEAIREKMMQKMLNDERMRKERENASNELIAEEQKNELENRGRNAMLEKHRITRELLEDMERQKIVKMESEVRQAKIDREFAEYLDKEREKCAIEDRRKQDDRRAKAIEYGKDLKEAIQRSRVRYAENILENQACLRRDGTIEDQRRKSIDEERRKMLEEHQPRLNGFLKADI